MKLPDPDYPRPERSENGKPYYWRASGYPTDRFLSETKDEALLAHMGVPARFRPHAIDMYEDPLGEDIEDWCSDMPYIFRPSPSRQREHPTLCGMGLALYGPGGTRKTTTAAAVLLRLVRMGIPNLNPTPTVGGIYAGQCMGRFVSWQDASDLFRRAVGNEEADEEAQHLRAVMRCESGRLDSADFLVLDDVSRERVTEYNLNELQRTLRFRFDYARPTILTTNFSPREWESAYGEVFARFLERAFVPVEFS